MPGKMFAIVALVVQVVLIVMYATLTKYADKEDVDSSSRADVGSKVDHYYPVFQDVHVMIFIGFGFLMTFLRKYGYSSVGFNFWLAAVSIQFSIIMNAVWHATYWQHSLNWYHKIDLGIETLITGDFAAGAVLISFGAVLGKVSPLQLIFMTFGELIFYGLNEVVGAVHFRAVDMGGSMYVHSFGAYFGLGVSYMIGKAKEIDESEAQPSYHSNLFSMIGTIFLWMFWPSFNGALATGVQQHRVIVNTVLSLAACCVGSFIFSCLMRPDKKFEMEDIQNATLAGGVAVGSSADLVIEPVGATAIGLVAAFVSVGGYVYVSPFLKKHLGLHDTCGVHNLHGMPGVLGAIAGAISAAMAPARIYQASISEVFPARGPCVHPYNSTFQCNREAWQQGGYQAAALATTLGISISSGILVGFLMKQMKQSTLTKGKSYLDSGSWDLPKED